MYRCTCIVFLNLTFITLFLTENLNDELEDELLMKHTSSGNLKEPLDIPTWMDHLTNLRRCPICKLNQTSCNFVSSST